MSHFGRKLSPHQADIRDLEILRAIDRGLSYAQCAARFGVSIAWVSKLLVEVRRDARLDRG